MTDLTFSMPDGRGKIKQTDRQHLPGQFLKKPDDSPKQYLMF